MARPLKTSELAADPDFAGIVKRAAPQSPRDEAITFERFDRGDGHARALQRQLAEHFAGQATVSGTVALSLRARAAVIVGAAGALWLGLGTVAAIVLG